MTGRWPNFFIGGVAKCGTTSLYRYLAQHPEIHMSPVKETRFFDKALDEADGDAKAIEAATSEYLSYFEEAGDAPIRGEGSPGYFYHPEVPARIHERVEDPLFLFSFRDPVERAYSDYLMSAREGRFERSFLKLVEDDIEALDGGEPTSVVPQGLYATNLQRYLDTFGREQVKIVLLDELKDDALGLLESTARFLDVDPGPMADIDYEKRHNPYGQPRNALAQWLRTSGVVRAAARILLPKQLRIYLGDEVLLEKQEKPPMDPDARQLLLDLYEPEINRLETILDRELPELRRSWDQAP